MPDTPAELARVTEEVAAATVEECAAILDRSADRWKALAEKRPDPLTGCAWSLCEDCLDHANYLRDNRTAIVAAVTRE